VAEPVQEEAKPIVIAEEEHVTLTAIPERAKRGEACTFELKSSNLKAEDLVIELVYEGEERKTIGMSSFSFVCLFFLRYLLILTCRSC
jgi:hypothetical protein